MYNHYGEVSLSFLATANTVHIRKQPIELIAHLGPDGDDSIVHPDGEELAIVGPTAAAHSGGHLVLRHSLVLWRPQP